LPAPTPIPTPAPIPLLPSSDKAKLLIMKVQTDLRLFGYANVPIDGAIGPETREALREFQTDWGLIVTGTITLQVLDAMGIPAT
jgi:His-Xaa-Ser repeat protein HxsA